LRKNRGVWQCRVMAWFHCLRFVRKITAQL